MTKKTKRWIATGLVSLGVVAVVPFLAYKWLVGSILRQLTNGQLVAADYWSDRLEILEAGMGFDTSSGSCAAS